MIYVLYLDHLILRFPAGALLYVWIGDRFRATLQIRRHHHHLSVTILDRSRSGKEAEPIHDHQPKVKATQGNLLVIPQALMKYRTLSTALVSPTDIHRRPICKYSQKPVVEVLPSLETPSCLGSLVAGASNP